MDDLPENTKNEDQTPEPAEKFWKRREKHGADLKYETAEELYDDCCKYFEWVEANPLKEEKVGFYEGTPCRAEISKMRAMTIDGLVIFLGIVPSTWYEWRKKRDDLSDIIGWAETVMRTQKFTGAAAGLFNANIIARDLGLHDIKAIQHLDADGNQADQAPATILVSGSELISETVKAFDEALEKEKADADAEDTA